MANVYTQYIAHKQHGDVTFSFPFKSRININSSVSITHASDLGGPGYKLGPETVRKDFHRSFKQKQNTDMVLV
jgi:hypothetical protein